ncbi:uncharacterized protein LOC121349734, partial [Pyrgilauda ruficollis]|uniref:uncharacterized protein LOC121349734 n=1 Tax=Pyrgilauda ruficollis TaxID=221976 RepID=UPI001B861730
LDPSSGSLHWILDLGPSHGSLQQIPVLDLPTGSRFWIPVLDPFTGSRFWIPVLDPFTGSRFWIFSLDPGSGSSHWIPVLDPAPGPSSGSRFWIPSLAPGSGSPHWIPVLAPGAGSAWDPGLSRRIPRSWIAVSCPKSLQTVPKPLQALGALPIPPRQSGITWGCPGSPGAILDHLGPSWITWGHPGSPGAILDQSWITWGHPKLLQADPRSSGSLRSARGAPGWHRSAGAILDQSWITWSHPGSPGSVLDQLRPSQTHGWIQADPKLPESLRSARGAPRSAPGWRGSAGAVLDQSWITWGHPGSPGAIPNPSRRIPNSPNPSDLPVPHQDGTGALGLSWISPGSRGAILDESWVTWISPGSPGALLDHLEPSQTPPDRSQTPPGSQDRSDLPVARLVARQDGTGVLGLSWISPGSPGAILDESWITWISPGSPEVTPNPSRQIPNPSRIPGSLRSARGAP